MRFDDPSLASAAERVPVLALADAAGLACLADDHLSVPGDKGANACLNVASLVAWMVAGADSIDGMAFLRHGGMGRVFARAYAPSTLGSFLRAFSLGHVCQLDPVASRFLTALATQAPQVAEALSIVHTLHGRTQVKALLRADLAFYGRPSSAPPSVEGRLGDTGPPSPSVDRG